MDLAEGDSEGGGFQEVRMMIRQQQLKGMIGNRRQPRRPMMKMEVDVMTQTVDLRQRRAHCLSSRQMATTLIPPR